MSHQRETEDPKSAKARKGLTTGHDSGQFERNRTAMSGPVTPVRPPATAQVVPFASGERKLLKNGFDPAEMGRRSGAARRAKREVQVASTREYIDHVLLPKALDTYDDLIDTGHQRYRYLVAKDVIDHSLPKEAKVNVDAHVEIAALIAAFKRGRPEDRNSPSPSV